jgi:protocatechuate 3,4-dioxygenase beta subunit
MKETKMARSKIEERHFTRRQALQVCLAPVGVAAARWLVGCGDSSANQSTDPSDGDDDDSSAEAPEMVADAGSSDRPKTDGSSGGDRGDASATAERDARSPAKPSGDADASLEPTTNDGGAVAQSDASASGSGSDASKPSAPDASSADVPWASGGTKSMKGNYPDPFDGGMIGAACMLYPAQTLGPCYASPVMAREDISDGVTGVPLRISFLVVKADGCTPVPNAEVDIWHTGSNGVYSAFARGTCNPDRIAVADMTYCRGKQNTNDKGRVDFSTVFPGWYTGRTIHIHFTVRVGGREFITSQLYFEDALSDELMKQTDYKARGERDTKNGGDSILRGANTAPLLFATAKRDDGALHAWKVLSIRS